MRTVGKEFDKPVEAAEQEGADQVPADQVAADKTATGKSNKEK
ncbi:MAG: hypothetical protein ACRC3H_24340 [Lachnospiraceae bacterium]